MDKNWKQLGPHGPQEPLLRIPIPNGPSSLVRFGPILGPSWGLSWAYVAPCVAKKCFKTHFESMLFSNTIKKKKFGFPEPLLDTKNQANHWSGCQKICFRLSIKSGSGEASWASFGMVFGLQVEAKRPQVRSMLRKKANKNSNKN